AASLIRIVRSRPAARPGTGHGRRIDVAHVHFCTDCKEYVSLANINRRVPVRMAPDGANRARRRAPFPSCSRGGSLTEAQPSSLVRSLASALWFPMFFIVWFMVCYLLPFHAPAPHDMPVAVVGEQ